MTGRSRCPPPTRPPSRVRCCGGAATVHVSPRLVPGTGLRPSRSPPPRRVPSVWVLASPTLHLRALPLLLALLSPTPLYPHCRSRGATGRGLWDPEG